MADSEFRLRHLYGQIILGVSPITVENKSVFVRHLSSLEQSELDSEYALFLDYATKKGLINEVARLEELNAASLWTDAEEAKLENQQSFLKGLKDTKKQLAIPSQVVAQNVLIEEAQQELVIQQRLKEHLLGLTVEAYANKKLSELYIFKSLYQDKNCAKRLYSDEEFADLEFEDLGHIIKEFNAAMGALDEATIKKIAIARFFQDIFALCDDNIFHFYGKPVISLTFKQADLASYGRFFKHVLSAEPKPAQDVLVDPDKLIDWYQTSKNTDKLLQASADRNVAIMGATEEDLKAMGGDNAKVDSIQSRMGGKTSARGLEFLKILG